MNIELRPLANIKPYEKNPRINNAAVEAVARSIRDFGFRQPIVIDGDGVIVVGHTRWKAAKKLGLDKVPVHVARELTPEQARAYRIADNKTGDLATWDLELLPDELAELQALDVDLSLLGFVQLLEQVILALGRFCSMDCVLALSASRARVVASSVSGSGRRPRCSPCGPS